MNPNSLALPGNFNSPAPEDSSTEINPKQKALFKESAQVVDSFLMKSLAKYSKPASAQTITDYQECRKLWDEFTPNRTLFDTWEFRMAFQDAYDYRPEFVVLKNSKENLALLPLAHDVEDNRHIWFGSVWQEEVDFFVKHPRYISQLLKHAPKPLVLEAISKTSIDLLTNANDIRKFSFDDPKYVLDLDGFKSHEDYLMTLKKNDRRNLRKDRNKIEKLNPTIEIDNFSDFDTLVELSKSRFAQKGEDTDWDDPRRVQAFRNVLANSGKSYTARMISIKVNGKPAGVDLICHFNDTYFAAKCGYNVYDFPGIGNYMNLYEIDDAIKLGMKRVDFLQSSYQWKNKFFKALPLFKCQFS